MFAGQYQVCLLDNTRYVCWTMAGTFAGQYQVCLLDNARYVCWIMPGTFTGQRQAHLLVCIGGKTRFKKSIFISKLYILANIPVLWTVAISARQHEKRMSMYIPPLNKMADHHKEPKKST